MNRLLAAPRSLVVVLVTLVPGALPAAGQEPVDEEAVAFFREQGLEHSEVMEHLSWMCDVYGPRLTASPNLRKAQEWAVEVFREWGLANSHLEEWGPFGVGWKLDHSSLDVIGENSWPVLAWPKAWSPSLDGRVEAEAVFVGGMSAEDLAAIDLEGKIVLLQEPREVSEPFEGPASRHDSESLLQLANGTREPRSGRSSSGNWSREDFRRRSQMMRTVYAKKPLAIFDRGSKGSYGTIFVSSASVPAPAPVEGEDPGQRRRGMRPWNPDATGVIPQFTLSVEHYNRIHRVLAKGKSVRLAVELRATFVRDDLMERNVIAEIPGTDPEISDQVVMLGAHYDSWHSSTGATDNGCGSAVMMEAMRLIQKLVKETGRQPRRTIRVGLWSGEEQGLLGSRAYVKDHFGERDEPTEEHARFSGYYNLDNGTGKVCGVYLQGNEAIAPIFRAWLKPFHDLGAATLTLNNTGGTDHQSYDGVGLPGFQFIQDPVAYSSQTHHSSMDDWDHAVAEDLKQAATIIASFAWHTAQRDELLPRKPARSRGEGGRRGG